MSRFFYLLAALVWLVGVQPAAAQVAVRPGSVDAPYVHVDWWGGRVHVCAPFVNIYANWPGCCECKPCCDDQVGSNSDQPRRRPLADQSPAGQLAASADKLYDSLGRFRTADGWRHYLTVAPGDVLTADQLRQTDSADIDHLRTALDRFDSTAADDQYHMISSLPAFQQTRGLLAQYLTQRENAQSAATANKTEPAASESVASTNTETVPPRKTIATTHWSPASTQPSVGLPGMARDIARRTPEELPLPPQPHAAASAESFYGRPAPQN